VVSERLKEMVDRADELGVHGLLFQHIVLCPTRTWLHYHRIDCAHLNRYMQRGLWISETTYPRDRDRGIGLGVYPDQIDWANRTVSEVKSAKRPDSAARAQLLFYMAVLEVSTGEAWMGLLRTPTSRRIQKLVLDGQTETWLLGLFEELVAVLGRSRPPQRVEKPLCVGCSYRLLCWGQTTEEES